MRRKAKGQKPRRVNARKPLMSKGRSAKTRARQKHMFLLPQFESSARYPLEVVQEALEKLIRAGVDTAKLVSWLQAAIPVRRRPSNKWRRVQTTANAVKNLAQDLPWRAEELSSMGLSLQGDAALLHAHASPQIRASFTMVQIMSVEAVRRATDGRPCMPQLATVLEIVFATTGWPDAKVNEKQLEQLCARNQGRLSRFVLARLPDLRIDSATKPDIS